MLSSVFILQLHTSECPFKNWSRSTINFELVGITTTSNNLVKKMLPDDFRTLLRTMDEDELVRTHIVNADPGPNMLAEALRYIENTIRSKFQLNENQRVSAIVVGSAKLGFSFIEKRRRDVILKPAYRSYEPGVSDVDIAVISPVVYGKIWIDLASIGARQAYFPNTSKLGDYMYHGWLRPDLFPAPRPQRCTDWADAYRELQQHASLRNKRLRLALYHSQNFLETYQQRGIRIAKEQEQML